MYIPDILRARVTLVSVLKVPNCVVPVLRMLVGDFGSMTWLSPDFNSFEVAESGPML
jgi:hypothetical protein